MFQARLSFLDNREVRLGPTDTRDEASRLARSWMDRRPMDPKSGSPVARVKIENVDHDGDLLKKVEVAKLY